MTRTSAITKQENHCRSALQFDRVTRFVFEYDFSSADLSRKPFEPVFLQTLLEEAIISHEEVLKITLVLQEALTNSLEHGNLELESDWKEEVNAEGLDKYSLTKVERLSDPEYADRRIHLTINYAPDELVITVLDQGKGFNMHSIKRSEPGCAILCYGRGLTIMDQVMDSVEYGEGGRFLELRKSFTAIGVED